MAKRRKKARRGGKSKTAHQKWFAAKARKCNKLKGKQKRKACWNR